MGIGILLFLVKHSRSDIANVTRELSKANDGANPAAVKALLCVIEFVLDRKNFDFKLEPTGNANEIWEIVCFGDSVYVGDVVN